MKAAASLAVTTSKGYAQPPATVDSLVEQKICRLDDFGTEEEHACRCKGHANETLGHRIGH